MSKHIPLKEVPCGVEMAKGRTRRHLNDARILIERGSIEGAALLTLYAMEELGRALILNERLEEALTRGDSSIELKDKRKDDLYSHLKKQEKAKTVIPRESLRIHKGGFGEGFGKGFDIDTWISQDLREAVTYIDYCDVWQNPPQIDVEKLKNLMNQIENAIQVT